MVLEDDERGDADLFGGAGGKSIRLSTCVSPLDGTFQMGGRRVDPSSITVPFLSVVGEKDTIAPMASA